MRSRNNVRGHLGLFTNACEKFLKELESSGIDIEAISISAIGLRQSLKAKGLSTFEKYKMRKRKRISSSITVYMPASKAKPDAR